MNALAQSVAKADASAHSKTGLGPAIASPSATMQMRDRFIP